MQVYIHAEVKGSHNLSMLQATLIISGRTSLRKYQNISLESTQESLPYV